LLIFFQQNRVNFRSLVDESVPAIVADRHHLVQILVRGVLHPYVGGGAFNLLTALAALHFSSLQKSWFTMYTLLVKHHKFLLNQREVFFQDIVYQNQ
jgi:hypothetical protein